jgi:hypothetical protein
MFQMLLAWPNTFCLPRFYGEAVVKACVENATSHLDISGEPQVNFNQENYFILMEL